MKTECCNYESPAHLPFCVMYNPGNGVVQCHNCGEVYVPIHKLHEAVQIGRDQTMKWVSDECKKNLERLSAIRDNLNSPLDDV